MEPQESNWDLRWTMFGVPVRVTPWFWLVMAMMGQTWLQVGLEYLAGWIACAFVSILIHELGHVFMGRYFGAYGRIVLVGFGGLAIGSNRLNNRWQRIAVSLAGPAAGFLFLGVILAVIAIRDFNDFQILVADAAADIGINLPWGVGGLHLPRYVGFLVGVLVFVNFFWGLINLLPVWPLDGGMACRELCEMKLGNRGLVLSLQISVGTAAIFVFAGIMGAVGRPIFILPVSWIFVAVMFGLFAYQSYQLLMQAQSDQRWHDDRWR